MDCTQTVVLKVPLDEDNTTLEATSGAVKHQCSHLRKYYIMNMSYRAVIWEHICHHTCKLKIQWLLSGTGWRSECSGVDGWVRQLLFCCGVKRGLFTGHSKQTVFEGVVH